MDGPEGIMLNEVSQTENDKHCTVSLTFRTKTNKSNFEKQFLLGGGETAGKQMEEIENLI